MDLFTGMSLFGGIAGLFGASSAQRAAQRRARELEAAAANYRSTMLTLAAPFISAGSGALGRIKGMTYGLLAEQANKESELLRGQYRQAIAGIERERARNAEASRAYWESANVGRGRGEQMRANAMAADSKVSAALSYGQAQEQYKQTSVDRYMNALGILQGAYSQGIGMQADAEKAMVGARMDATKMRAEGDSAMNNMIAGLGGQAFGAGMQGMLYNRVMSQRAPGTPLPTTASLRQNNPWNLDTSFGAPGSTTLQQTFLKNMPVWTLPSTLLGSDTAYLWNTQNNQTLLGQSNTGSVASLLSSKRKSTLGGQR